MSFAIYHCEKGNVSSGGLGHHIDRTQGYEHTYKHADPNKRYLNVHYGEDIRFKIPLHQAIEKRIKEGYRAVNKKGELKEIRKDAVKYTTHILTGSHDKMIELSKDKEKFTKWIVKNKEWLCNEFGEENIVRFTLHMDERTPHIHAVTVNLTSDGRLSAKEVIGNRAEMRARQDRYADAMKEFGLKRGLKRVGIKHEDAKEYYARMNLALKEGDESVPKQTKRGILGLFGIEDKNKIIETLKRELTVLKTNKSIHQQKMRILEHNNDVLRRGVIFKTYEDLQKEKQKNQQLQEETKQAYQKLGDLNNAFSKLLKDENLYRVVREESLKIERERDEKLKQEQEKKKLEKLQKNLNENIPKRRGFRL